MSAAWIERQIHEASVLPLMDISGVAYQMRYTCASELGMGFELALKALLRASAGADGKVLGSHDLLCVWREVDCSVRLDIDGDAEDIVCRHYGSELEGRVLPFEEYVGDVHSDFLNREVKNRYGLEGDRPGMSEILFLFESSPVALVDHNGRQCADGIGILTAYWCAIMKMAHELGWPEVDCRDDEELFTEKEEARDLVTRAANQLIGPLSVMTEEELSTKRVELWVETQRSADGSQGT